MDNALSIIHLNSRSLQHNYQAIKEYLTQFPMFNIIAVSETWVSEEKAADVVIEGCELCTTNRENRNVGRVAMFIRFEMQQLWKVLGI